MNQEVASAEEEMYGVTGRSIDKDNNVSTSAASTDDDPRPSNPPRCSTALLVEILEARYGPAPGQPLWTGERTNSGGIHEDDGVAIPYTRNVAPFIKTLLMAVPETVKQTSTANFQNPPIWTTTRKMIRLNGVTPTGMKRVQISLAGVLQSMNTCFGDPCPGVSKRLHLKYCIEREGRGTTDVDRQTHVACFSEHEPVVLWHRSTRRPASLADTHIVESSSAAVGASFSTTATASSPWQLSNDVSEMVLPFVLPFLSIPERVRTQRVGRTWRKIVREFGVATVIQYNHHQPEWTLPFLRGLLRHSYQSLQTLILADWTELQPADLHPSIPHLVKLWSLDVSRCIQLNDTTLQLLAQHCGDTLQVLYIKGLRCVTDQGVLAICERCVHLQVLEVSHVPLTDAAGVAMSRLQDLRAIYMRDNYQLTNASITPMTRNCHKLEQLTLWGCIKLHELQFAPSIRETLVLLNLWGCHGLSDNAATTLEGMVCLRTLIVNECHRLTDAFFVSIAGSLPQLRHLQARYCKRLTDAGLTALSQWLQFLYSLDLGFCTRLSAKAITDLLELRADSLGELRLQSCRNLSIGSHKDKRRPGIEPGSTGRAVVVTLQKLASRSRLSALDVRDCGGQPTNSQGGYMPDEDLFVQGMLDVGFQQRVSGYFERAVVQW